MTELFGVFPHTEESHNRFSATEVTNKTLAAEMQELRARLTEAEDAARVAERQKGQLQRLLQEFRRRLGPLQLEVQRMVEKVRGNGTRGSCALYGERSLPRFCPPT